MSNAVPNSGTSLKTGQHLLDVLSAFGNRGEWGVTALAEELSLSKTVTHRLLRTLADAHFVEQTEDRGPYVLGSQLIALARTAAARTTLASVGHKHLVDLAETTQEVASLDILRGHRYVCVDMVDLHHHVTTTVQVGDTVGLHAGAGKVILAYQHPDFIEAVLSAPLARYTDSTPHVPTEIKRMLRQIKSDGRWVSDGEVTTGTRGVAMPVYGHQGTVEAAVTVTSAHGRIPDSRLDELFSEIQTACKRISWDLGVRPSAQDHG